MKYRSNCSPAIDPNKTLTSTTRFVMFDVYSALPQEKEILFIMHAMFRVSNIKQTIKNNHLWEVQLTITGDSDPQPAGLTNRIKKGSMWLFWMTSFG
ncbi:unnamed protein product [Rotaria magnacalcarata]|uniref:Uncharacterized protein n=1 Tax=Rotaria magnacalcarata TaxID=392030 RepID=A0A819F792_9BILA|nr:unnamed protein product [Rotaria magnacalcarata]CAF2130920.1 unnamed protein product [Rotaria magnacalcarata]CAF2168683.1 unnamed protein product [Rotaria magnacalcarata]CAF3860910.1 unnamed protein product [Rotaria magnacalcarata]CAF4096952.1 unnamed protein product [Rotaria magnacalcarata]